MTWTIISLPICRAILCCIVKYNQIIVLLLLLLPLPCSIFLPSLPTAPLNLIISPPCPSCSATLSSLPPLSSLSCSLCLSLPFSSSFSPLLFPSFSALTLSPHLPFFPSTTSSQPALLLPFSSASSSLSHLLLPPLQHHPAPCLLTLCSLFSTPSLRFPICPPHTLISFIFLYTPSYTPTYF